MVRGEEKFVREEPMLRGSRKYGTHLLAEHRLILNPVMVFMSLMLWSWLWRG
jgi:hypothetical protein